MAAAHFPFPIPHSPFPIPYSLTSGGPYRPHTLKPSFHPMV
jgi:hypothetical protein